MAGNPFGHSKSAFWERESMPLKVTSAASESEQRRSMAAVHEFLKARFAYVRQDLDEVLARLKDTDLSWSPAEGMRTIAGQLLEIANKDKEVRVWLQVGVWPDDGPNAFDADAATLEDIRAALASI